MFRQIGKVILAFVAALILVGLVEGFAARSTPMGSIVPLEAHVFVLAVILIYLTLTASEIRDKLDVLIDLERERAEISRLMRTS